MSRIALLPLVVLLALFAAAPAARADEVFVLDNGMVLRGTAMSETDKQVVLKLTDFPDDARITVETSRIVNRRPGNIGKPEVPLATAIARATDSPHGDVSSIPRLSGTWKPTSLEIEPLEDITPPHESFVERLQRVTLMAMPQELAGRLILGGLFFVALLALVGLGGRLLEIEGLNLPRSAVLAAVLGGMVVADTIFRDVLLRADAAIWVVPAQVVAWLGLVFATLHCGFSKSVLLLAFMLFSLAVVTFTAGAVLVAF
jgi:hypothetical protein